MADQGAPVSSNKPVMGLGLLTAGIFSAYVINSLQRRNRQAKEKASLLAMQTPPPKLHTNDPYEHKRPDTTRGGGAGAYKKPTYGLVLPPLHILDTERHLLLGMVGLPARGKTYIAKKLARYLSWLGYKTKVFNVGEYRRKIAGADKNADFFDPANEEACKIRNQCARLAWDDLMQFFAEGGQAAIYDATNSNQQRRQTISQWWKECPYSGELVWVESICDDPAIVEANILDTKLFSPDYVGQDPTKAVEDFKHRIDNYTKTYVSVTDDELGPEESYVKIIDAGRKIVTCGINGYLAGRIVFFLQNLNLNKKPIWISRHGESQYNLAGRIGGDSLLSQAGMDYAQALGHFVKHDPDLAAAINGDDTQKLSIWCSTLRRTIQTATTVHKMNPDVVFGKVVEWRGLTEIDAGIFDGLTYEEIKAKDPAGFAARTGDKLRYRYPQGESYIDVIERVEGVIFELERAKGPVLVIGHQAVLRCLMGYFLDSNVDDIPYIEVPLHEVIKLTPKAYKCQVERIPLTVAHNEPASQRAHRLLSQGPLSLSSASPLSAGGAGGRGGVVVNPVQVSPSSAVPIVPVAHPPLHSILPSSSRSSSPARPPLHPKTPSALSTSSSSSSLSGLPYTSLSVSLPPSPVSAVSVVSVDGRVVVSGRGTIREGEEDDDHDLALTINTKIKNQDKEQDNGNEKESALEGEISSPLETPLSTQMGP